MPLITTRVTAGNEATVKNAPLSNEEIDQNFININNAVTTAATLSQDLTGFINRTSSTISFDETTRVLTLAPVSGTFSVYYRGKEYPVAASKTVTIANTSGGRYIVYDYSNARLVDIGTNPNIKDTILVAYVYWDSTSGKAVIFGDERHSTARDTMWHYYQHLNMGALWRSGGDATYTVNNSNLVTFGLTTPIVVVDEDLEHSVIHSSASTGMAQYEQTLNAAGILPVMYLSGTTYRQYIPSTTVPWMAGSSRALYNPVSGGVGSTADIPTNDKFLVYWCVATNCTKYPIKLVLGRTSHDTYAAAETEDFDGLDLPMPEIVPMYKIILQTRDTYTQNIARVQIVGAREMIGKQNTRSNSFDTISHNILSDKSLANQHPISAITNLQESLDAALGSSVAMAIALG